MSIRPTFSIITPAEDEEARRIVTAAQVRALTGIPSTGDGALTDAQLNTLIDGVLADAAEACHLQAFGAYPLTLAREVVRAEWPDASTILPHYSGFIGGWPRGWFLDDSRSQLILPWRAPITAITVTEGGVELVQDTDYRLFGAGVVQRLGGGFGCCWPMLATRVDYTAGWLVDDDQFPVPANLIARIADQVKLVYFQSGQDPNLRSEDIPGVWSGSYNYAGGDVIEKDGLLRSLHGALARFKGPPVFA